MSPHYHTLPKIGGYHLAHQIQPFLERGSFKSRELGSTPIHVIRILYTTLKIKEFVSTTLDEQQNAIIQTRFGIINGGTLLMFPGEQFTRHERIGTCFL